MSLVTINSSLASRRLPDRARDACAFVVAHHFVSNLMFGSEHQIAKKNGAAERHFADLRGFHF
jgi:hypothetical protein